MSETIRVVVFRLDEQRYALLLAAVERIVRAVEVTCLPNAPPIVLGVIDVEGRVLPVLSMRRRLRLPEREIRPIDQFLIARTGRRTLALVIDEAQGVIERPASTVVKPAQVVPGLEQFHGLLQLDAGLVLIHDLDNFLSLDEACALDEAMRQDESS